MIELPQTTTSQVKLSFEVPYVLISRDGANSTIREGGLKEIGQEQEISYSFDPPAEEETFRRFVTNTYSFGGKTFNVLNDPFERNDSTVPASVPSASEYMAKVGQRVLHARVVGIDREKTRANEGQSVYRIARFYINVP